MPPAQHPAWGSRLTWIKSPPLSSQALMGDFTGLASARKECLRNPVRKSERCILLLKISAIGVLTKTMDVGRCGRQIVSKPAPSGVSIS